MPVDLLVAGHVARDLTQDGWRLGGGVAYAAAQGKALGLKVAAVTVCDESVDPAAAIPGVEWHVYTDGVSTTFENRYVDGGREQRLLSVARPLTFEDIPLALRGAPIVYLAPLFHELDAGLPSLLHRSGCLLGIGVQGWLRGLDGERVRAGRVGAEPPWLAGDVAFLSEEDAENPESAERWCNRVEVVVLTRARNGCRVWQQGRRLDLPAQPAREVDPTGAGDVFAAAFLVRFAESHDAEASARFASVAAALSVGGVGFDGVAGRAEIEANMRTAAGSRS